MAYQERKNQMSLSEQCSMSKKIGNYSSFNMLTSNYQTHKKYQ